MKLSRYNFIIGFILSPISPNVESTASISKEGSRTIFLTFAENKLIADCKEILSRDRNLVIAQTISFHRDFQEDLLQKLL